jgi:phosphate starvation-inducible PhoH-like protein
LAPSEKEQNVPGAEGSGVDGPGNPLRILIDGSMVSLLGPSDRFLRTIENQYPSVSVHVRGNEITLTGKTVERDAVHRLIMELQHTVDEGHTLDEEVITTSARMLNADSSVSPSDLLGPAILTTRGKSIRPKTLGQKEYSDAIDSNTVVFGIGPAGTGKTYIAMAKAVRALQRKEVDRIILTRPAVEAGERLGFLPGSLTDKIEPLPAPAL